MGYDDIAKRQSLAASLTQASDAMPGASGRVEIGQRPGRSFRYSGGGYTLLQLMIEDVSGSSFDQYLRERVLLPLGMTDSAFEPDRPLLDRLVLSYTEDGKTVPTPRFTALAAASLYTTPRDMTAFVLAHFSPDGLSTGGDIVLSPQSLFDMRAPHAKVFGREVYGLGTLLSAKTRSGTFVFGHDGRNSPAISTAVRINPDTSDAIVIFASGDPVFAARLASEWTFWQLGRPDVSELNSRLGPLALRAAQQAASAFLLFSLILFSIKYGRQHSAGAAAN
jgi:CubicO group peptidase (beta-lactamase class C family)